MSKSSEVWKYFETCMVDSSKCICTICHTTLSRGRDPSSYTTSSMHKHLSGRHNIIVKSTRVLLAEPKQEILEEVVATNTTVNSPEESSSKRQCLSMRNHATDTLTQRICEMICLDYLPLSFAENRGFRRLLATITPHYNVPSTSYLTDTAIPQLYEKLKNEVKNMLFNKAGTICVSSDVMSGPDKTSYVLLSANLIVWDKGNLKRVSPLLSCKELNSKISDGVCTEIFLQEENWETKFNMLVLSGQTEVNALHNNDIKITKCVVHYINAVIKEASSCYSSELKEMLCRAKAATSYFHLSSKNSRKLENFQIKNGLAVKPLTQDDGIKFTSMCGMLKSLIEQKLAVNFFAKSIGAAMEEKQWKIADSLLTVLKPFEIATEELCDAKASIAYVLPTVKNLLNKLKHFQEGIKSKNLYQVREFVNQLKNLMKVCFARPQDNVTESFPCYFADVATYNHFALAAVLDPRIKDTWASDEEKTFLKELLELSALEHLEKTQQSTKEHNNMSDHACVEDSVLFASECDVDDEVGLNNASQHMPVRMNVYQYITSPTVKRNICPLQFWMKYNFQCPALFSLAIEHLSSVPTSIDAESLFNSHDVVMSPLTNNLKSSYVEMLSFLHVNLHKLHSH